MKATRDLIDADTGEVVVEAGKKITPRQASSPKRASSSCWSTDEDMIGQYLAEDIVNPETGEVYLRSRRGNRPKSCWKGNLLSRFESLKVLDIDHVNVGAYIRNTLMPTRTKAREEALFDIYRVMRPGEPPTMEAAEAMFQSLFFDPSATTCRPLAA
jgi:DNA-directed RNA polymerase subunit beta